MSLNVADLLRALELNTNALDRNTLALYRSAKMEDALMADLSQLTQVVSELADDESALKTSVDAVVAALAAAQSGGFTPQNQSDLNDAVAKLQQAHTELSAMATEAGDAVNPPAPAPAPAPAATDASAPSA